MGSLVIASRPAREQDLRHTTLAAFGPSFQSFSPDSGMSSDD